jgi:capsular polysaccharide biosynthesis protein
MPGIMSALKWEFLARIVVTTAFNDPLLQAVMKGVAKLPSTPHRVRLPCTLDMINHIITINTTDTASMNQLMLATGVAIAYFLCLRVQDF